MSEKDCFAGFGFAAGRVRTTEPSRVPDGGGKDANRARCCHSAIGMLGKIPKGPGAGAEALSDPRVPGLDAQIGALEAAFTELVKALGRAKAIEITQIARTLENAATAQGVDAEKAAGLVELARKLRQ